MIVNIAAWLYIVFAALSLWALGRGGVHASMETLVTLAVSALFAAMGVGLLKRLPWARWLAMGYSLLGWTLGTLVLLACVGLFFTLGTIFGGLSRGGLGALLNVTVMLILAIMVASIVISFKLFFHLRTEEGASEFGVELESFGTVMGSVGAWVAIFIAQSALTYHGSPFRQSPGIDQAKYERKAREEYEMRDRRLREERAAREAQERARLETQHAEVEMDPAEEEEDETSEEPGGVDEATEVQYQPIVPDAQDSEPQVDTRNQILKCRDASGAMQYTQGYCPPGTKRVD